MNVKKIAFLGLVLGLLASYSCKPTTTIAAHYSYETECLGVEGDGSQTLKAWGKGIDKTIASAQAKKKALKDVLFKGISKGNSDCNVRPLIVEVNAEEKHEDYFLAFFGTDGAYKKFVSNVAGTKDTKFVNDSETVCGLTVRVSRSELRKQLVKDKILTQ
jgi:hypothetical protein